MAHCSWRNSHKSQAYCFVVTLVFIKPTRQCGGIGTGVPETRRAHRVATVPEALLGYERHSLPAQRWGKGMEKFVPTSKKWQMALERSACLS